MATDTIGTVAIAWALIEAGAHQTKAQAEGFSANLPSSVPAVPELGDGKVRKDYFEKTQAPPINTSANVAYVSTHGDDNGPYFNESDRIQGISEDGNKVQWGNTLCWLIFDACLVFNNSPSDMFKKWSQSFNGLRAIFGFGGEADDEAYRGAIMAGYLGQGATFVEAWRFACEESAVEVYDGSSNWSVWAYLRAGSTDTLNDCWSQGVGPAPPSSDSLILVSGLS